MEIIALVFGLAALALLFGPAIGVLIVSRRSRVNRQRIASLETELSTLRRRIDDLGAGADPVAPAPEGVAEPAATAPAPSPAAAPGTPTSTEPEPHPEPAAITPPPTVEAAPPESPPPSPQPPGPPASEPPPRPPRRRIDWEHWVGVRGAAVLGGMVLALAALLFLKYSIDNGLIPPIVRVGIGFFVGIGAVVAAERLRSRDYGATANALSGAGVVILYGATWASRSLYGLVPEWIAWGLMILITATCGLLSWRHRSLVIASLGLAGGFLTPLLLGSALDRPVSLFAYLLVLDAGLLVLARRRRWPALAAIALLLTAGYQAVWILGHMGSVEALLGLAVLALFAALFVFVRSRGSEHGEEETRGERLTRAAALLVPFAFALYYAGNAEIGPHLWPLGLLLAMLSFTAAMLGDRLGLPRLGMVAVAADLAVVTVWMLRHYLAGLVSWETAAVVVGLALSFQLAVELRRRGGTPFDSLAATGFAAAAGLTVVSVFAPFRSEPRLWPWLLAWVLLAGLLVRLAALTSRGLPLAVGSVATATGLGFFFLEHGRAVEVSPGTELFFAVFVALAVGWQLLALPAGRLGLARPAALAAALFPLVGLVFLLGEAAAPGLPPVLFLGATTLLALLAALAFSRLPSGAGYAVATALLALVHWTWSVRQPTLRTEPEQALLGLGVQLGAALLFTAWPFLARRAFAGQRFAWYASALAGPAWFLSLLTLWRFRFGGDAIGVLPIALGAVSLAAAAGGRSVAELGAAQSRRNLVWFSAIALVFVAVAIPLQLDKQWITIGWALAGLGVVALWQRLDHPGLKAFGLLLLALSTVRLLLNPAILGYHPAGGTPILNWLLYTYLVPAAALLGAAAILRSAEVSRQRSWESLIYAKGWPIGAAACAVAAIFVVFAWINLTIVDAFSTGGPLSLSLERLPARDLTLSLAWALYALVLLALGVQRNSTALRWLSLGFLVITIAKVFLYDLGELEDLYRVASLVGLAFSLLAVSLAYQRFVFRKQEAA